jgi:GT2 family glycosyltransferase
VNRALSASIVIACYTEERWALLRAAVESALSQSGPAAEVIVVVDHNENLLRRVAEQWPTVTALPNEFGRGASGARNTGAFRATTPIIAFLDDDAAAEPSWLQTLLAPFEDPSVIGVGGGVSPDWQRRRPAWFPDEFGWVVGVSYRGLPEDVGEVRNVWAENMAVRADRFRQVDGFRLNFGKVGTRSSPEDTDLCIRMAALGGRWLYVPKALVAHHVPVERSTFAFFVRRSFSEGQGKAALRDFRPGEPLESERAYTRHVLPAAVGRGIRDAFRDRRPSRALQSGAIVVGLSSAGAGYLRQRLSRS